MPGGRPSKFNAIVREKILQAVSVGAPFEAAAESAGVSYAILRKWLKRGERNRSGEFSDFVRLFREAKARALIRWLAVIDKAAQDGNWAAAAWKIERRYPKDFARPRQELIPERQPLTLEQLLSEAGRYTPPPQAEKREGAG